MRRQGGAAWSRPATRARDTESEDAHDTQDGTATNVAIAVVTAGTLLVAEVVFALDRGAIPEVHSGGLLLFGAASIAILGRRPFVTAVVVGLCLPLYYVSGTNDAWTAWLLFFVTVMRLAASGQRAAPMVTVMVALGFFMVGESLAFEPWRALTILAWMIVIVAAAEISRNRAAYLRETERRAAEAERTREEEARRRATEERLRIARELHDVIAHNISLINVQAASAVHRRDPERAYAALEAIKAASKDTLRELRATLGVLRQVDEEDNGAPVTPERGLDQLPALVRSVGEAGLDVGLTVNGAEDPAAVAAVSLPAPVGLATYRIVQEALTNVRRHSGVDRAEVTIERASGEVTIQVVDAGGGSGPSGSSGHTEGNGLRGMRERVSVLGGRFEAGHLPSGGFRVRAIFPVDCPGIG
ncbi:histidine kinase [Nocardiopsis sp. CT-R113]|uniref:histidine kinase n=1 Tax=Nocardiopsis codii TaxID=3065942 RepID=A0ABU7KFE3_9ACTN|nr:histidine kinase [Nocardiopsis sp. CT-R113]MEE2040959.1 histidine kinase [Nocardiopsis sp. CT-R113]